MSESKGCCVGAPALIFACSGAADLGEIADRAARKLTRDGAGRMFCLAGIGGRVSGIMRSTEAAARVLAIDGCSLDCAKSCLQQAGFTAFEHLRVSDLGMGKGTSPATDERVALVADKAKALLAS
jgi:uncharacterized metal-binding protein